LRVLRITRPRLLEPWQQPLGECRILGIPIREHQERTLAALGLKFAGEAQSSEPDALCWDEDVVISTAALKNWLKLAKSGDRLAILEAPIRRGKLEVEEAVELEGKAARSVGIQLGAGTQSRLVPPLGWAGKTTLPGPFKTTIDWYATMRVATTIRHWVQLLSANLSFLGITLIEELGFRPYNLLSSWLRWPRHLGSLAKIGRGCSIHPTATLSGCILGDKVSVGAYSVLRGCIVGEGAVIEDHVTARSSILEPYSHLANYSMFNFSVLGERSSIGHIGAQASIIGRESFISTFATLQDLNLQGNVRVLSEGKLVDAGTPFLGCAIGHRCKIGAFVSIAPGRVLSNDITLFDRGTLQKLPQVPGSYPVGAPV
jgi:acetyltransferase-like isoleucine patch superfamily enzyme